MDKINGTTIKYVIKAEKYSVTGNCIDHEYVGTRRRIVKDFNKARIFLRKSDASQAGLPRLANYSYRIVPVVVVDTEVAQ